MNEAVKGLRVLLDLFGGQPKEDLKF